eukprot:PhF_6_TR7532/c0_g1_i1/m.11143
MIRRFICGVAAGITLWEYYIIKLRTDPSFPWELSQQYIVDASPAGRKGLALNVSTDDYSEYLLFFSPRNGDIITAAPVPNNPNWMMLPNGYYVQHRQCGVNFVRPV